MDKSLIIIRGLPGSGKTTLANLLAEQEIFFPLTNISKKWPVCSADDFFINKEGKYVFDISRIKDAHKYCEAEVIKHMSRNVKKIFVANTFTQEWEMKNYFELAKQYEYKIFSIIVENRNDTKNIHNVPDETIEKMKNRFQIKL